MVDVFEQLFSVIWQEKIAPRQWRRVLLIYLRKGIGRILVIPEVSPCLMLWEKCFVRLFAIYW